MDQVDRAQTVFQGHWWSPGIPVLGSVYFSCSSPITVRLRKPSRSTGRASASRLRWWKQNTCGN